MKTAAWFGVCVAILLLTPPVPAAPGAACDGAEPAIAEAARLVDDADEGAAERRLREAAERDPACAPLAVAFLATTGLQHARHAATRGGPEDLLAPVLDAVARLAAWREAPGVVRDAQYAEAALRAAMAASQDERPELQVWITHTTDLASRLALAGEAPRWPLPPALLAGDLWYEVDRYAEAIEAYREALDRAPSAYAHRGLARTWNRMRDLPAACRAYRALEAWLVAREAAGPALDEARAFLARPACQPPGP